MHGYLNAQRRGHYGCGLRTNEIASFSKGMVKFVFPENLLALPECARFFFEKDTRNMSHI